MAESYHLTNNLIRTESEQALELERMQKIVHGVDRDLAHAHGMWLVQEDASMLQTEELATVGNESILVKSSGSQSPLAVNVSESSANKKVIVMGTAMMWQTCALAVSLTVGMVFFLYWQKGLFVIIKVMVYLLALTTMKGAVKMVEDSNSFRFPLFLTATHFVSGAVVAFAVLFHSSVVDGVEITKPSLQDITTRFGPIALAFVASISMGNMALVYSTSAFVEIVGASAPIATVLMTLFMKQPFDMRLLAPCLVVLIGCTLTSNGEPRFSAIGLILAAGSNFPRAVKTVLQQLLLQQGAERKMYEPLQVLGWTCLPASVIIFSWSLLQEGLAPYRQWHEHGCFSHLTFAIFVTCLNATILNTAILFVVKDLGAIGTQLVAQTKSLLVVLGGMCVLKEQVSSMEIVGYALVMAGVYAYNDLESRIKKNKEAEKQMEKLALKADEVEHRADEVEHRAVK